jgi:hypothetical protein
MTIEDQRTPLLPRGIITIGRGTNPACDASAGARRQSLRSLGRSWVARSGAGRRLSLDGE